MASKTKDGLSLVACCALLLTACGPSELQTRDAGTEDDAGFGQPDSGVDAGVTTQRVALDLNDVSFLFPLPADAGQLLPLHAEGSRGPLLPEPLRADLPERISRNPVHLLKDVRIVAARVDPCFRQRASACRRQIRLVAQPMDARGAADATVHLFYDLTEGDFAELTQRLHALKALAGTRTDGKPLGVHPVMELEGLEGPYATALRKLLMDFCGGATLSRVALMVLQDPGTAWQFSALDLRESRLVADKVPRMNDSPSQSFIIRNDPQNFIPDTAAFGPLLDSELPLLFDLQRLQAATTAEVEAAVEESHRIENPLLEDPGTIDCVSCHVSHRGRSIADRRRGISLPGSPSRYANPRYDLTVPADGAGLVSQRAFGYFARTPSISVRTVHETAAVAEALSR